MLEENKNSVPVPTEVIRLNTQRPVTDPQSSSRINDSEDLTVAVKETLQKIIEYHRLAFISVSVFTIFRSLTDDNLYLSFMLGVHCWTAYYIYELILLIRTRMHNQTLVSRPHFFLTVSALTLLVIFTLLLSFQKWGVLFINAYSITFPLAASFFLNFAYCATSKTDCHSLYYTVEITFAFFRLSMFFMILMKSEDRISSSWPTALWPLWIAITLLCLGCFAVVFVISVIADYNSEQQSTTNATCGGVWVLCMCAALTVCVIYTTCRVVSMLNEDMKFKPIDYFTIAAPNLAYLLVMQLTFCCMRSRVE